MCQVYLHTCDRTMLVSLSPQAPTCLCVLLASVCVSIVSVNMVCVPVVHACVRVPLAVCAHASAHPWGGRQDLEPHLRVAVALILVVGAMCTSCPVKPGESRQMPAPQQQGRQAGTLLGAWLGLFSATEEALQHLINSTPYVNTSKHRVPKAEACPASHPLGLLPRAGTSLWGPPKCACVPARTISSILPSHLLGSAAKSASSHPPPPCGISPGSGLTSSLPHPCKSLGG